MSTQFVSGSLRTSFGRAGFWLLPAIIGLCGCAQGPSRSLARVWDESPKIRWSRVPDAHPERKTAESKVAANTPAGDSVKSDPSGDDRFRSSPRVAKGKSKIAAEKRTKGQDRPHAGPHDPFLDEERSEAQSVAKRKAAPSKAFDAVEPQVVSPRARLRKTLLDDTHRPVVHVADSGEQEQLRLRIESLMSRAKAHCEDDEWVAARRAAELAQSLADSSGLEFDPDDERPIELLTMINNRMEAEAEAAHQELADSEGKPDADQEQAPVEDSQSRARPGKRRFPFDGDVAFDSYPQHVASAHLHDHADGEQVFGPSMVVLESPSFEEESEVSPIAYSRPTGRLRIKKRFSLARPADSEDWAAEVADVPGPPQEDVAADGEIELPESTEADDAVAPSPPWSEPSGPALEPLIPAHDRAELATASDELGTAADEELRPASAWPRWLPLSLLSLLTAAFCAWLWRRRLQTAE